MVAVEYFYGAEDRQNLDFYRPERLVDGPCLVYVHGGAWKTDDKADHSSLFTGLVHVTGFPLASINYRLSPSVVHPSHILDVKQALSFILSEQFPVRVTKLVLIGHSCGAFIALSIRDVAQICAYVCLEGIYDLHELVDEYPSYRSWFIEAAFGQSPSKWPTLQSITVPTVLLHSHEDELLTVRQTTFFAAKQVGNKNLIVDYDSIHGSHDDSLDLPETAQSVAGWIDRLLSH